MEATIVYWGCLRMGFHEVGFAVAVFRVYNFGDTRDWRIQKVRDIVGAGSIWLRMCRFRY